jgi:hypothetical protein
MQYLKVVGDDAHAQLVGRALDPQHDHGAENNDNVLKSIAIWK